MEELKQEMLEPGLGGPFEDLSSNGKNTVCVKTVFDRDPDAVVIFRFNGTRRTPVRDGYRPAHRIREDYLTTGVHHYFDVKEVAPNGEAQGTITFLSPEVYPNSLWVGKTIDICEGERIVGSATVEKVLNPILEN